MIKRFRRNLSSLPPSVRYLLIAAFVTAMGLRLNWLFLNFWLEELDFGRNLIGYANAVPAISVITLGIPASIIAPRIGYTRTLRATAVITAAGAWLVASALNVPTVFFGLFLFGLGTSLILATTPPLVQQITPKGQRVLVFALIGAISTGAGFLGNLVGGQLPNLLGSLQNVFWGMGILYLLAVLPLLRVDNARETERKKFRIANPKLWGKLLLPNSIIALGAGLIMPFLNLYLADKFGLSFEWIGFLFSISALATTVATLLQPKLVEMWGKVGAVAASQGAALPFILILAYVPFLPLVTLAMFVREAMMNAVNPIYTALGMQLLNEEEAAAYMIASNVLWRVGWAISSSISGELQAALGVAAFDYLFAGMFALYSLSIGLLLFFFWGDRQQIEREALEMA